jgi:hypothetical protein
MDEMLRRKRLWIGLGALALIFMCVMVAGAGLVALLAARPGPVYGVVPQVQPPAGGESGAMPAPYYGYAPVRGSLGWGLFGIVGFGIGLFFKLLVLGLLLMLFFRLARRLFWGPRYWGYRHWGPCCPDKSPQGGPGEGTSGAAQGPWAWHRHHRHWGPPPWWGPEPGPASQTDKPQTAEPEYTGPQE